MRQISYIVSLLALLLFTECTKTKTREMTPWGSPVKQEAEDIATDMSLDDIINNGELIMLTLNGPDNYYDYHGRGMGTEYLLCERFAQAIGVSLRVEVCKDTSEVISRLDAGDGDIAALALPRKFKNIIYAGVNDTVKRTSWAVANGHTELADTLNRWFKPQLIAEVKKQEDWMLSSASITRHVYSPMLNRGKGIISEYDHLFQKYAPTARWDWRLLAAQCYQESTFDPRAHSWAGACGLMQIMPSTADKLGLSRERLYEPEENIAAATRYISQIDAKFRDIPTMTDRISFVLASYNGGYNHIRDAMALARKYGRNERRWSEVSQFVLKLREARYYNDPVVKYGYMRGSETYEYVERIHTRWNEYRGAAGSSAGFKMSPGIVVPQKATKKYKYHV